MKQPTIVHQRGDHDVRWVGPGHYEIYRNERTHAVRRATVHHSTDPARALRLAIATCTRLACKEEES